MAKLEFKADIPLHDEVVRSLNPFVDQLLGVRPLLEKVWKPTSPRPGTTIWIPDHNSPTYIEERADLRKRAQNVSDAVLAVWVGDMVTEGDIGGYVTWLNRVNPMKDPDGRSRLPWARWDRRWHAEEWVHGITGRSYAEVSGRINMRALDLTTQYLIDNGFDPGLSEDPYEALIYVSFQELATETAHGNEGYLVKDIEPVMANVAEHIRVDERGHALFYRKVMKKVFEEDPNGAVIAMWNMMRKGIEMPAALMTDEWENVEGVKKTKLFSDYSAVAQSIGVYTADHYIKIMEFLMKYWKVEEQRYTTPEAEKARDFLVKWVKRLKNGADKSMTEALRKYPDVHFSWLDIPGQEDRKISIAHPDVFVPKDYWYYELEPELKKEASEPIVSYENPR